jgi:hypothetical protein
MSHRALEIIDGIAASLRANASLGAVVLPHRALTMDMDEGELPAVSVYMGDDSPVTEAGVENFTFIDSLLEVVVDVHDRAADEPALVAQLAELRRQVHIALQADITQGLAYVSDTRYGGASRPQISTDGEFMAGSLSSRWIVRYRMNAADPG